MMLTKKISCVALALASAFMAGCATTGGASMQAMEQLPLETALTEDGELEVQATGPVFVEFKGSPLMTRALREGLAARGVKIAQDGATAAAVFIVDGKYQAVREKTGRVADLAAGAYIENPGEVSTRKARGSLMVSGDPFTLVMGSAFSTAGNATGFKGSFNAALTGDPDGVCFPVCDRWVYEQRAVLSVRDADETEAYSVVVQASHIRLQPAPLMNEAVAQLANQLGITLPAVKPLTP